MGQPPQGDGLDATGDRSVVNTRKIFRAEIFIALFLAIFALGALAANAQSPAFASLEQRGAEIFQREHCFFCHSVRDAPAAPPRVTFSLGYVERIAWQWLRNGPDLNRMAGERTDDWLLAHLIEPGAIVAGCPMPSYAYLPPEELQALIAYIQQANPPADATMLGDPGTPTNVPATRESYLAGRALYRTYCEGCHGREGNGAGAVGHLLQPEPRNLSDVAWMSKRDDAYLFQIVAQGKAKTAMPGYAAILTNREQALVLYYLRFFADPSARQAMEEGLAR